MEDVSFRAIYLKWLLFSFRSAKQHYSLALLKMEL